MGNKFLYTSLRVYAIFVGVRKKKKKVIDRIVVRSALTFPLPDAFDFDVRKRAAYRWKAENLTFPTVCGTSLYINSKGVKIWGKVGRKIVILLMLRGLSGWATFLLIHLGTFIFFAHPLRHHFFNQNFYRCFRWCSCSCCCCCCCCCCCW